MWPFMLIGGFFATATTLSRPGRQGRPGRIAWILGLVLLVLFIGLRHHVGMDWNNYLRMIHKAAQVRDLVDYLKVSEPGYAALLMIGHLSGGGIYVTNLLSAAVFCLGLFAFARQCREPWLAVMTALPFFVIAFGMSANRQALAAGIVLIGLAYWENWGVLRRVAIILAAAMFHASAVIMLGFVGLGLRIPLIVKLILVGLFSLVALFLLQSTGRFDYYDGLYGRGQSSLAQSSGALIHVALNAVPAMLYFFWRKKRQMLFATALLRQMGFAAMLTLPMVLISSAAAGRISLYWYPVSMSVLAALPGCFAPRSRRLVRILIVFLMMLELAGWLLLANSSIAHLPYRNALFIADHELHIGIIR